MGGQPLCTPVKGVLTVPIETVRKHESAADTNGWHGEKGRNSVMNSVITKLEGQITPDMPNGEAMLELIGQLKEQNEKRRQILTLLQEGMQELRLQIKYLIFDLEATRRERDELKAKLGDS